MKDRTVRSRLSILSIAVICILSAVLIQGCSQEKAPADQAKSLLEQSGIKGGLIVHINCGDGTMTEALKADDGYLVQGLDPAIENVQTARQYIMSKQEYGPVSVDLLTGNQLPYKDNLVNMIVSEDLGTISKDEAMRVLIQDDKV